ncbi:plexin domain-containing protein 2-like, partial [Tropilaelaps mercedesae]
MCVGFLRYQVTMPSEYSIAPGYTNQTDEAHEYYNSSLVTDPAQADALWIDLDSLPEAVTHDMLSESYRRAATVNLTFAFPFYGHPINNVTIATGGFLYVGYALHMWLAATQYIAPLMANFKASANSSSALKYYDNGVDRHRQSWINNKCEENATTQKDQCRRGSSNALAAAGSASAASAETSSAGSGGGAGGLSALLVLVVLVMVLVGWLVYAYRNPRSASGQLLIKYRPSQWKRHGEARYIAA